MTTRHNIMPATNRLDVEHEADGRVALRLGALELVAEPEGAGVLVLVFVAGQHVGAVRVDDGCAEVLPPDALRGTVVEWPV